MHSTKFSQRQLARLRSRLLDWFAEKQRDLPWRRDRDPYRIWVSEAMLQQTTVAMVLPRFEIFLRRFPNVAALAAAEEQDVLRHWEGLGYYRRARDLHRACRQLVELHRGELPDDPVVWRSLPGVGRYILGAVLSQAFERKLPIVEANSQRVLCRLHGQEGDPGDTIVKSWLWETAAKWLPRRGPGDFNQALMELGALVCTPTAPDCSNCPISRGCVARKLGKQLSIPAKPPRAAIQEVNEVALVIRRGDRVLLVQRPLHGRWASMWEFPHLSYSGDESIVAAAERLQGVELGINARLGDQLATIRHAVTRYRITMTCLESFYKSGELGNRLYPRGLWLAVDELPTYPVSTPQRKLAKLLSEPSPRAGLVGEQRKKRQWA